MPHFSDRKTDNAAAYALIYDYTPWNDRLE